jgi:hypothetical protein
MMMLWAWAGVPLGVYNIVKEFNIALRIQPQILTLLSLVTWIQCYYYERVRILSCQTGQKVLLTIERNGVLRALLSSLFPSLSSWGASKLLSSSLFASPSLEI